VQQVCRSRLLGVEAIHSLARRTVGGAPADERQWGILRSVPRGRGNVLRHWNGLAHPLAVLVATVLGALDDAGIFVVLVALRHPDSVGMTGQRAGRDAALGDLVALVTLGEGVEVGVGQKRATVERHGVEVEGIGFQRAEGIRQVLVAQHHDRRLVALSHVEGLPAQVEGFFQCPGRQNHAGEFILRGMEHKEQVGLFGAGR